jgi:RNA polymerase sigma-70 factor (ECF subfamily)
MERLKPTDQASPSPSAEDSDRESDEALWQRFVAHEDTEAFGQLFLRYERTVLNLTWRLLGHREEAEDIKQEAFLRVLTKAEQFRGDCSFKTWILRIAHNLCYSALRRRRRRPETEPLEALIVEPQEEHVDANPEAHLLRRELTVQVQNALQSLPEHHRTLIVLRELEGLSYEEIAETLGCSRNAVKVRLYRAREALRKKMQHFWSEPP